MDDLMLDYSMNDEMRLLKWFCAASLAISSVGHSFSDSSIRIVRWHNQYSFVTKLYCIEY